MHLYCTKLVEQMRNNRGKNFPGTIPQTTIQLIFRQQSFHWRRLVREAQELCLELTEKLLRAAMDHVAGEHTADLLWDNYGSPLFDDSETALESKMNELLWPFEKCHPIVCSLDYQIQHQNGRLSASSSELESESFASSARKFGWNADLTLAAEAVDREQSYRQVSEVCMCCGLY